MRNHYKQYVDLENEVAQRNSKYLVEFFYEMLITLNNDQNGLSLSLTPEKKNQHYIL